MGALIGIVGPAFSLIKGWVEGRVKSQQQKQAVKEAITEARIKAAQQSESDAAKLRQLQVQVSGTGLKWLSYLVFASPLIWAMIAPHDFQVRLSAAMDVLPAWWVWGFLSINGAVWGIAHITDRFKA